MSEVRGYTCDGGCGARIIIDRPHELATRQGWMIVLAPEGPQRHFCSWVCVSGYATQLARDEARMVTS